MTRSSFLLSLTIASVVSACGAAPEDGRSTEEVEAQQQGVSHATGTVFDTDGDGLNVRQSSNTSSDVVAHLDEGQTVDIECQETGESIEGTTVWNYLADHGGYVTDAYLYTGHDGFIPGVVYETDWTNRWDDAGTGYAILGFISPR